MELYLKGVDSSRKGVFYNTFAYPTKISPESIAIFIATHTEPGSTILDVFGGSGSTGIAAKLCSNPTEEMLSKCKKLGLTPNWGIRNCVLMDIGVYASFASKIMCEPPDENVFSEYVSELIKFAESELGQRYEILDNEGNPSLIRYVIWTDVLECPECRKHVPYSECMVEHDPISIRKAGICPYCGYVGVRSSFRDVTEEAYDSILKKNVERKTRIPYRIYGQTGKMKWSRDATEDDIASMMKSEYSDYFKSEPKKIEWGDLHRSGYHFGISYLHQFYTRRNFNIMAELWNKTADYPEKIRDALRLLLLSYNQTHSTLMTRVVAKKNSKDFILTGAQSGVLYISSLPVEKNIISGIKRKAGYFKEAFRIINGCTGNVTVLNESSTSIPLPDKSVDYVFTDPPFGDFIPYAEVNQINELWLDKQTERREEIIISPAQGKTNTEFQNMMGSVFKEVHRVLKDGSATTVVFHASKASIWNTLEQTFFDADFTIGTTAILNKTQQSFKQVVSEGSVRGDPLILLYKKDDMIKILPFRSNITMVQRTKEDHRIEYSRYVEHRLRTNSKIEYDAHEFYEKKKQGLIDPGEF